MTVERNKKKKIRKSKSPNDTNERTTERSCLTTVAAFTVIRTLLNDRILGRNDAQALCR